MPKELIIILFAIILPLIVLSIVYLKDKYYIRNLKVGQIWSFGSENPFSEPKYVEILDIKKNKDREIWIQTCRVYKNQGVYFRDSTDIDEWNFKYFKEVYKLIQNEKNNTLDC